jgi:hypothetical protein
VPSFYLKSLSPLTLSQKIVYHLLFSILLTSRAVVVMVSLVQHTRTFINIMWWMAVVCSCSTSIKSRTIVQNLWLILSQIAAMRFYYYTILNASTLLVEAFGGLDSALVHILNCRIYRGGTGFGWTLGLGSMSCAVVRSVYCTIATTRDPSINRGFANNNWFKLQFKSFKI